MSSKVDASVEAVKQLLQLFRLERMVYLIITLICLILLIVVAVMQLIGPTDGDKYVIVSGLIGSSGGIVYTAGRLLKMWSEAMQLIQKAVESND
jgi:1,4-dihydroxy-2-naphthoate octaprenyltransferase